MQDIPGEKRDLLESLFPNHGCETPVIVGGQQRLCRVTREISKRILLPLGKTTGFSENAGKFLNSR